MSGSEHARPVWLTKEQRDWLTSYNSVRTDEVVAAWDAAPADPAEALREAITRTGFRYDHDRELLASNVLRALGAPDA